MSVSLWCEEDSGRDRTHQASVRAPWDPSASGQRVIQRLLQSEERYLPSSLYISLVQREPQRREELAKWTMEVCCECDCDESVFPLAVSLLDRYLSATLSLPVSPSCLAAACILLASKVTESDTVSADTLCAAAEYDFLSANLREMERVVLATLRWDVLAVTPQDFIPLFLRTLGELRDGDGHTGDFLTTMRRHGDTLVAMCVCDSRFLGTPPSLVAAAALNSALRGLRARSAGEMSLMTAALATLCQTDVALLQCCTELIDGALRERLRTGAQEQKDGDIEEEERASTPTDLREIDF
ncbi:cyclin Dx [Danio rerio]|uniref:Cyclin Dx n=2 Tax=Danio rerio TaxID=7955 RepID=D3GDI9_DANRE|nr:cyclin Dx [Danio rerio]ACV41905.1 cyclin Dx [Danio rerio]AFQ98282.1 cyclin Dx [Danio rerio]|eukprot:NP_001165869.1 cyclin Dx [Danio rerio]